MTFCGYLTRFKIGFPAFTASFSHSGTIYFSARVFNCPKQEPSPNKKVDNRSSNKTPTTHLKPHYFEHISILPHLSHQFLIIFQFPLIFLLNPLSPRQCFFDPQGSVFSIPKAVFFRSPRQCFFDPQGSVFRSPRQCFSIPKAVFFRSPRQCFFDPQGSVFRSPRQCFSIPKAVFFRSPRQCFFDPQGSVFSIPKAVFFDPQGSVFRSPRQCFFDPQGSVFSIPKAVFFRSPSSSALRSTNTRSCFSSKITTSTGTMLLASTWQFRWANSCVVCPLLPNRDTSR